MNLNIRDNSGNTAVAVACSCGYEAIVRLLIIAEVDLTTVNDQGQTALCIASDLGHETITTLLHEALGSVLSGKFDRSKQQANGEIVAIVI